MFSTCIPSLLFIPTPWDWVRRMYTEGSVGHAAARLFMFRRHLSYMILVYIAWLNQDHPRFATARAVRKFMT